MFLPLHYLLSHFLTTFSWVVCASHPLHGCCHSLGLCPFLLNHRSSLLMAVRSQSHGPSTLPPLGDGGTDMVSPLPCEPPAALPWALGHRLLPWGWSYGPAWCALPDSPASSPISVPDLALVPPASLNCLKFAKPNTVVFILFISFLFFPQYLSLCSCLSIACPLWLCSLGKHPLSVQFWWKTFNQTVHTLL